MKANWHFLRFKGCDSLLQREPSWTLSTERKPTESRINREQLLQKQIPRDIFLPIEPRLLGPRWHGCRISGVIRSTIIWYVCLLVSLNVNTSNTPARIKIKCHTGIFSGHCNQIPRKKQRRERTCLESRAEKRPLTRQTSLGSRAQ